MYEVILRAQNAQSAFEACVVFKSFYRSGKSNVFLDAD